jgi:hypothetical protein
MTAKHYNYIFYLTVRTLNWCSNNFIIQPLIKLLEIFSVSDRRIQNVKKGHLISTESYSDWTNVSYAFGLMLWSLSCFIFTISLLIFKISNAEFENSLIILLSVSVTLSIAINYITLWKSDRYEKYFKQFQKEKTIDKGYFVGIIYHLTIATDIVLTVIYI